jgi:hypothetical protein
MKSNQMFLGSVIAVTVVVALMTAGTIPGGGRRLLNKLFP